MNPIRVKCNCCGKEVRGKVGKQARSANSIRGRLEFYLAGNPSLLDHRGNLLSFASTDVVCSNLEKRVALYCRTHNYKVDDDKKRIGRLTKAKAESLRNIIIQSKQEASENQNDLAGNTEGNGNDRQDLNDDNVQQVAMDIDQPDQVHEAHDQVHMGFNNIDEAMQAALAQVPRQSARRQNDHQVSYSDPAYIQAEAVYSQETSSTVLNFSNTGLPSVSNLSGLGRSQGQCVVCRNVGRGTRKLIPDSASLDLAITSNILLAKNDRACLVHYTEGEPKVFTDEAKALMLVRKKDAYKAPVQEFGIWIERLLEELRVKKSAFDFGDSRTPSEAYKELLGLDQHDFEELFAFIRHRFVRTKFAVAKNYLAIFLAKLRLGVAQSVLGIMFHKTQGSIISKVSNILYKNFFSPVLRVEPHF